MDKQETEISKRGDAASWYYKHAAIISRKIGQPEREVEVLERYAALQKSRPTIGDYLTEKLTKTKARRAG